jgi:hypothetical protein
MNKPSTLWWELVCVYQSRLRHTLVGQSEVYTTRERWISVVGIFFRPREACVKRKKLQHARPEVANPKQGTLQPPCLCGGIGGRQAGGGRHGWWCLALTGGT